MSSSKKANRPDKRVLVRWSDDLDKQVLLTIQWACNEQGLRIPWEKVAEKMGEKFSEGAIIQHLAKLRQKMEANNIPVPPPLKRGTAVAPSKIYAAGNKRKAPAVESPKAPASRRQSKSKAKKNRDDFDDEESSPDLDIDNMSDGEYGAPKKLRRVSGKRAKKANPEPRMELVKDEPFSNDAISPKAETGDTSIKGEPVENSLKTPDSAGRTRGLIQDYAKLDQGSDVEEQGEEDQEMESEDEPEKEDLVKTDSDISDGDVSPLTKVVSLPVRVPADMGSGAAGESLEGPPIAQVLPNFDPFTNSGSTAHLNAPTPTYDSNPYQVPIQSGLFMPTPQSMSFSMDRNGSMSSMGSQMSQSGLPSMHSVNNAFPAETGWFQGPNDEFGFGQSFSEAMNGDDGVGGFGYYQF